MYLKNQSRKQKKRGVICIAALMLALAFSGCGEKEKKADTTTVTKENETTTETKEGTSQSESEFDFSQVYDNIELNGKKIPFPFTLNDLGEEYDFKWDVVDMGDGLYGADLAHNGETVASIYMYGESINSINRNSLVVRLEISRVDKQEITINGINCKSSVVDINNAFINLLAQYNKNNEIRGYRASDNDGMVFDLDIDNNEIIAITLRKEIK